MFVKNKFQFIFSLLEHNFIKNILNIVFESYMYTQ